MVPDTLGDTDVSVRLWVANSRDDFGITLPKRKGTDWRDGQQLTELIKGLESGRGKAGRMEETGGKPQAGRSPGPARPCSVRCGVPLHPALRIQTRALLWADAGPMLG